MSARLSSLASSSALIRAIGAVHVGATSVSVLYSLRSNIDHETGVPAKLDTADASSALPWIDQLHSMVAAMYACGTTKMCRMHDRTMVQVSPNATLENPLLGVTGADSIEGIFASRMLFRPSNDVKTELECIRVESSDDSICGGGSGLFGGLGQDQENETSSKLPWALTNPFHAPRSPPTVEVTYRLSQRYGRAFSTHSMLVVSVQVKRNIGERIRSIDRDHEKIAVPLATSSFSSRAVKSGATLAAGSTATLGPASVALSDAVNKRLTAIQNRKRSGDGQVMAGPNSPFVAEIVRVEERWNGVELLQLPPIHWSRKFNGFVGCLIRYFIT